MTFIHFNNGVISLSTSDTNNLFILEKNDDKSYYIKYEDTITGEETIMRFLTANGNTIEANEYLEDSSDIKFYIELQEELFIENSAKYTADNRFVKELLDTTLKKSSYNTDSSTGLLTSMTNPKNVQINYTYNNKRQCTKVSQGDIDINYSYTNDLLSSISQGTKNYSFNYDDFLKITEIRLNNILLSRFFNWSNDSFGI